MEVKLLQIKEASGEPFGSAHDVFDFMYLEARADREIFWVLHLNTKNQIIEKEITSMGVLDSAPVHPREVFKKAVMNSTAAIICVHNHPSGDLEPSKADREMARQLIFAGEIMGIPILDFLIISKDGYRSFADDLSLERYKSEAKEKIKF